MVFIIINIIKITKKLKILILKYDINHLID